MIWPSTRGRWPFLAPAKNSLDDVKIQPFRPPNVDSATKTGIVKLKMPKTRSPNVIATAFDPMISSGLSTVK